jgi:hypothetical protein
MRNPILRLKIRQMHLRLIGDASANRKVSASLAQVKCLQIADLLRIVSWHSRRHALSDLKSFNPRLGNSQTAPFM